jgi:CheY-like chemotaxis protein
MQRILIVDDDELMRDVMAAHLSDLYEVTATCDSERAIALTLEDRPDAILLDLSMPGLSGFELCKILSSLGVNRHIPILIVSGKDERNKAFCERLGAVAYFTKPIDFPRLKAQLAAVLASNLGVPATTVALKLDLHLKPVNTSVIGIEASAAADSLTRDGFICTGPTSLLDSGPVEVFLRKEGQHSLGLAQFANVIRADNAPHYVFKFLRPA